MIYLFSGSSSEAGERQDEVPAVVNGVQDLPASGRPEWVCSYFVSRDNASFNLNNLYIMHACIVKGDTK